MLTPVSGAMVPSYETFTAVTVEPEEVEVEVAFRPEVTRGPR
ncbi:hypothetical protein [Streptomyces nodosus]|nr:hypothetical protein [Streptomyces nodosus]MBB4790140.1 hypothetical protein [Streptomyces nodosus]